jgi:hypothetical protein
MKTRRTNLPSGIVALALTASLSGTAFAQAAAQQPPPIRVLVSTTYVKPDMVDTWQNIIRTEAVPANKKAGVPWRWVFIAGPLSGDNFRFITVIPVTNYAMFDSPNAVTRALGPDGAAKYNAKLRPTILSQHFVVQTLQPNLSMQSYSGNMPALAIVTTLELMPGKGPEFAALQEAEYLPAMKKAGLADYLVFATNFGGPGSQRSIVQYLSKYADLDQPNPLQRALGVEGAQKVTQRRQALISRGAENAVYRLLPDLSYGAPTRPKN